VEFVQRRGAASAYLLSRCPREAWFPLALEGKIAPQLECIAMGSRPERSKRSAGNVAATYLAREVIAAPLSDLGHPSPSRLAAAAAPAPDANAIAAAARMLAQATRPLIVTANAGRDAAAFAALAQFIERFAIPVVQHRPRYLSLPSSHPMNLGFDPARLVQNADTILVLESDVPWIPSRVAPRPDCKVIQCGLDPLFSRYPIRCFPCDVAITGSAVATLAALTARTPSMPNRSRCAGAGSRTSARY
jgi:acetolactate synthase-1/2/3 large subunit